MCLYGRYWPRNGASKNIVIVQMVYILPKLKQPLQIFALAYEWIRETKVGKIYIWRFVGDKTSSYVSNVIEYPEAAESR